MLSLSSDWLTDRVAPLYGVGGMVQGWEAGVRPATFQFHKQSFFGWAGEVASPLEGAIGATRTLFFLREEIQIDKCHQWKGLL